MICDSTFLDDLARLGADARAFLAAHRRQELLVSVISAGELAAGYDTAQEARAFLARYRVLRLTPEIAYAAAAVDGQGVNCRRPPYGRERHVDCRILPLL